MNKIAALTSLMVLFFIGALEVHAYEYRTWLEDEATTEQLADILIKNQKWVNMPAYRDRAAWDDLLGGKKAQYIQRGEAALAHKWVVITAQMYLEFLRSGNRVIMESPMNANNAALSSLFLAELAEGKGRFIPAMIDGVFFYCEMTSWVLSAHLPKHTTNLPDYRENVVDLIAGEVSSMLSWVYYYFRQEFDKTDPIIALRLKSEIQRRVFDAFMATESWWVGIPRSPQNSMNNWNPWCNFNVLQSFLLVEDDVQKLTEGIHKTMVSVDEFLSCCNEDGCCDEGTSYWGHAAGKLLDYLQLLYIASDGKIDIFDQPMVKNLGEYISRSYVGDGWVVNFADASAKGGGEATTIYEYGKYTGSQEMMHFGAYLNWKAEVPGGTDIFRAFRSWKMQKELPGIEPAVSTAPATWYPQTQVCYVRNQAGVTLAAKGGHNGESHNHNDVGTFSMWYRNEPVFIDAGVGTYTRQTFSKERYSIWTMQSDYHNVPQINGASQVNGRNYKANDVSFDEKKNIFRLDIAEAYPKEAKVKNWVRSYRLNQEKLIVSDQFQLEELSGQPNLIRFLTWKEPKIGNGHIELKTSDGSPIEMTYDTRKFEAKAEPVEQDDSRLSNVWGNRIHRITLTSKVPKLQDTYTFTITVPKTK